MPTNEKLKIGLVLLVLFATFISINSPARAIQFNFTNAGNQTFIFPIIKYNNVTSATFNLTAINQSSAINSTYVDQNNPNTNYAEKHVVAVGNYKAGATYKFKRSYIRVLTENLTEDQVFLSLYQFNGGVGGPFKLIVSVAYINESLAQGWNQNTMTWNNQPCGTGLNMNSTCVKSSDPNNSYEFQNTDPKWIHLNITECVRNNISNICDVVLWNGTEVTGDATVRFNSTNITDGLFKPRIRDYPNNTFIDFAGDGDSDWLLSGYMTNTTEFDFTAEVNNFRQTCTATAGICNMTNIIHSDTWGELTLDALSIVYNTTILDNCTDFADPFMTFTIYNETDKEVVNGTLEVIFRIWYQDVSVTNQSFKFENNYTYSICSNDFNDTYQVDADMQYYDSVSADRNYYLREANLTSDGNENITLYLMENTNDIRFEVLDNSYIPISNAVVTIQKLDMAENLYFTNAMVLSDFEGEGLSHLVTEDVWYRFIVTVYSGTNPVSYTFDSKQLYYDASIGYVSVQLVTDDATSELTYVGDFAFNCTSFRDATDQAIIRCLFTNTEGLHSTVCLDIYNYTIEGGEGNQISHNCTSDVSTTMFEILPNVTSSYFWQFLYTDSSTGIQYLVDSGTVFINILAGLDYPRFFIFVSITFVALMGMLTVYNPEQSIILSLVSLGICGSIFRYNITLSALMSMGVIGLLIISRLKK